MRSPVAVLLAVAACAAPGAPDPTTIRVAPVTGPGPWLDAVPTLAEALDRATPGATILVSGGGYAADLVLDVDDLLIRATDGPSGDRVVLESTGDLRVEGVGVILEGLTVAGTGAGAALRVAPGADLALLDAAIDAAGLAVAVDGGTLTVERTRIDGGPVLLAARGAAVVEAVDSLLRGSPLREPPPGSPWSPAVADALPEALVTAEGAGTTVLLAHSTLVDAPERAAIATRGARVRLEDGIVAATGTDPDRLDAVPLVADGDGVVEVVRSLVQGPAFVPHAGIASGPVVAEDLVEGWPGFASPTSGNAALAITVDDGPNLDHAVDLSRLMDDWGFRLTWFASGTGWFTEDEEAAMRDLVDRGHEVGCHTRSHPVLTRRAPFTLTWRDHGGGRVRIADEGTRLVVEGRVASGWRTVAGPWDLDAEELRTTLRLCEDLDALPELDCALAPDANGAWTLPTELADGTVELPARVAVPVPWDRRPPSEGGRFFTTELVGCRTTLEAVTGGPVTALAYPGQKHDALVEAAVDEAGFAVARGSASLDAADWLVHAGLDRLASPMSLTVDEVKGWDWEALDAAGREARVRGFVRAWGTAALEAGMVGALTIHTAETLDTAELEVLLDEAARIGLPILDMEELDAWLEAEAEAVDDRVRVLPAPTGGDHRLVETSDAVDAGRETGRTTDALGQPIYGAPDLGPYEFQPTRDVRDEGVGPGGRARVYADGRMRFIEPERTFLPGLRLVPAGVGEVDGLAPRPALLDYAVGGRSTATRVQVRVEPASGVTEACALVDGLRAGTTYRLRVLHGARWRDAGLVRADADGGTAFALDLDGPLTWVLEAAARDDGPTLPACTAPRG